MEYCSSIKRNEVLTRYNTWMSLENIILGERSWTKNAIHYMVPNVQNSQICKDR